MVRSSQRLTRCGRAAQYLRIRGRFRGRGRPQRLGHVQRGAPEDIQGHSPVRVSVCRWQTVSRTRPRRSCPGRCSGLARARGRRCRDTLPPRDRLWTPLLSATRSTLPAIPERGSGTTRFTLLGGSLVPSGGGYYYDSVARQEQFAFPAGSGFWLILPADVWVDETIATLESLPSFDGSKGFTIPLYKGWNMVGNPYAHQVPWRAALFTYRGETKTLLDAEFAGWVRSTIYTYGGGGVSTYVGVTDRDLLEPDQGYWVCVGRRSQTRATH